MPIKINEKITASTRECAYLDFWFLVEHSLSQASADKKHSKAFALNAAIMAVMTVESLINDLSEQYLPEDVFICLDKEFHLKTRFKKMIKFLTGQEGEFFVKNKAPDDRSTKIKKIEIGDIFHQQEWQDFCKLLDIRNKITHRKVENKTWTHEDGNQNFEDIREDWKINIEEIEPLINSAKNLLIKLRDLFMLSIEDFISERLTDKFDFME
ncbi:hypothetical protein KAR28_06445 [Candidatus Parcubacteria bacterium]|nr:hypothetical protein [Candidatus Parcubacteria bacterium]